MKNEISRGKPGWLPERQEEEEEEEKRKKAPVGQKKNLFRTKQRKVSGNDIS